MTKQKVLVPVDGSPFSKTIFPVLQRFCQPEDVELVLLEAIEVSIERERMPPSGGRVLADMMISSVVPEEYARQRRDAATQHYRIQEALEHQHKEALQEAARPLVDAGFTVSYTIGLDDPAKSITDYAADAKMDMIAMATHGHTGMSRLLLGSVAQKVLQTATVPVLLLRPF